ncbi:MAG TPA: Arc family DNA-binding protein [Longimicrobiales bacterium]|nr:Arc family DNA-binding protein [Longimicrobiales bacterium]
MPSLTIKNLPETLYERLKLSAERNRRSLNSEVILRLEEAIGLRAFDPDRYLAEARELRERLTEVYLSDADIAELKEHGRS